MSSIIKKINIKTTMRYHYSPTRLTKMKPFEYTSISKDVDQLEMVCILGVTQNWYNPFWKKCSCTLQSCKYTYSMTQ